MESHWFCGAAVHGWPKLPAWAAPPSIARAIAKAEIFTKPAIPSIPAAILKDDILDISWSPVLEVLPHHAVGDGGTLPESCCRPPVDPCQQHVRSFPACWHGLF